VSASMGERRCAKCGEVKSPSDFHRDRSRPDGLFRRCKVCRRRKVTAPPPPGGGDAVTWREEAARLVVKSAAGSAIVLGAAEARAIARDMLAALGGQEGDNVG